MSSVEEQPQVHPVELESPPNTAAQDRVAEAADEQWAKEKTWPRFEVVLTGDEVEWVARAGVNLDDEGVPQPWNAVAKATVTLKAQSEDQAKAKALQANPDYHTVESCKEVE